MAIPFVKMHGIGNDYVYLDAVGRPALAERTDLPELARRISDRHRGVGSDGLILVCLPTSTGVEQGAHVRMRMFNSDGSESEMCGNGIRCVAKFAHDRLGFREKPLRVETGRGVLSIDYTTHADDESGGASRGLNSSNLATATVDMGEPILDPARIPVRLDASRLIRASSGLPRLVDHPVLPSLFLAGGSPDWIVSTALRPNVTAVSMGNPHAVFFCSDVEAVPLWRVGPEIERWDAFPQRTNAHFVHVRDRAHASMRTWERGAGLTQACGTGACAVLVAGVLSNRLDREATLTLPGGDLHIRWDEKTNHVFMTGPAEDICEGVWTEPTEASRHAPPQPTLTTERLVLRPLAMSDAPAVAQLAGEKRVYDHTLLIPHPYQVKDATSWISSHMRRWAAGELVNFAITLRDTGELIGAIGLVLTPTHRVAELGYWVGVPYWNRGYATEAARAVIAFGFEQLKLNRISAYHFPPNTASGRVLEKVGMTLEGVARLDRIKDGSPRDSVQYAITRPDWTG